MQTHGNVPSLGGKPTLKLAARWGGPDSRDAAVDLCPLDDNGCFPGRTRIAPRGQYSPTSSSTEDRNGASTTFHPRTLCPPNGMP